MKKNPQLDANKALIHLLSTEGLPRTVLEQILDRAAEYVTEMEQGHKKFPVLTGKSVFNLFFLRTRPAPAPPSRLPPSVLAPMSST